MNFVCPQKRELHDHDEIQLLILLKKERLLLCNTNSMLSCVHM
jgi:hypothetical protein